MKLVLPVFILILLSATSCSTTLKPNQDQEKILQKQISTSDVIIYGEVILIESIYFKPPIIQEHSPNLHAAHIKINKALKGNIDSLLINTGDQSRVIGILFPESRDIMWYNSPKFVIGQRGIWLLHWTETISDTGNSIITALMAPDPIDFQSENRLSEIKEYLNDK